MAARRCSLDAINYPYTYLSATCPVCNGPTDYFSDLEPDDDWKDKVAAAFEQQAVEEAEAPEILTVVARVRMCGERLCVDSDDVYHSGGKRMDVPLPPMTLIQIGHQTFEILGHRRTRRREYVVRTFSLTLSKEDLAKLVSAD